MKPSECGALAFSFAIILLSLFEFCLGVSEAVFVSRYDQFENGCESIWKWILGAACINIIIPCITVCGIQTIIDTFNEDNKKSNTTLLNLLQIGQFVIGIWSMNTYQKIDKECYNFWESNAPELWTFVAIHYVMTIISITIAGIAFIVLIGVCCNFCWNASRRSNSQDYRTYADERSSLITSIPGF